MTSLSEQYKNNLPFEAKGLFTTIDSDYNALNNETIFVNTASTAITIYLPENPLLGSKVVIIDKENNATQNKITISGNGNNINDESFQMLEISSSVMEFLFLNQSKGWIIKDRFSPIQPPGKPLSVSATDIGTNRPFNNGAAFVSFTEPAEGDPATSYKVLSTPGNFTATGISSPILIDGLESNTSYSFNVIGINNAGEGEVSNTSTPILVTTVPSSPQNVSTTARYERLLINFNTPQSNGGKNITGYKAISNFLVESTSSTSPISASSLTPGTQYFFNVIASNENGDSLPNVTQENSPYTATGGTISNITDYRVHTFTGTNNFVLSGNSASLDYLIISGGGGGAYSGDTSGGGGGAGGYIQSTNQITSPETYVVTVGGGGPANSGTGSNSSFNTIQPTRGGAGGSHTGGGASGGSGGGAGGATGSFGVGTPGEGNNGGPGGSSRSGGGGGAGTAGVNSGGGVGGGGTGASSNINGTPTTRAVGGAGSFEGASNTGSTAGANTGSGGGGGGRTYLGARFNGGAGGSGIVIIRYPT
jgi:hypothetical protein